MRAENLNSNRFVLDSKNSADLSLKLKQDPQAGLKQAAQQFEGLLLQMVLKSMRDASPQDGLLDTEQTRFFTSILDQQLGQNLSAQDKLGFAKLIEQQLGGNLSSGSTGDTMSSALDSLQKALLDQQASRAGSSFGSASSAGAMHFGLRGQREGSIAEINAETGGGGVGGESSSRDFVNRVWPHAVDAAKSLGVPPHFLVAHSALESGWGRSEIRAPDGSSTYNIFGVKAGKSWQGASVEVQTTEYVGGSAQSVREKFRVYRSYGEAFADYADLLRNSPRFQGVIGQQDGSQFARSLQRSGYATDPMYADKLSRIINGATLRQSLG